MTKKHFPAMFTLLLVFALGAVTASAATKTVIIKVEGMTCGGCAVTVEKALKKTPGVEDAKVSYEKGEAWVKYDDAKVTLAKLREVINNTGFKAGEAKEEQ
jgi:mercuric transport protein